jgi:hypothetical protein
MQSIDKLVRVTMATVVISCVGIALQPGGQSSAAGPSQVPAASPSQDASPRQGVAVEHDSAAGSGEDIIVLRSQVFDIPFQMDSQSPASRVRLYWSSDHGQSWKTHSEKPISTRQFHINTEADGEFWFTIATDLETINDPGRQLRPQRKILVDSQGPAIELTGAADVDGSLALHLMLKDQRDVATLRVLYATDVTRQWVTVRNDRIGDDGRFVITPNETWRQISVHVTATDSLGNASVKAQNFQRPRVASRPSNRLRVQPAAGPNRPPQRNPLSFGSSFHNPVVASRPDEVVSRPDENASGPAVQADTLPRGGLSATVTPKGVEVVPAPEPETASGDSNGSAAEPTSDLPGPAEQRNREVVPTPSPAPDPRNPRKSPGTSESTPSSEAAAGPDLDLPPPNTGDDSLMGPLNGPVTQAPPATRDGFTPLSPAEQAEADKAEETTRKRPRTLSDAMRPLGKDSGTASKQSEPSDNSETTGNANPEILDAGPASIDPEAERRQQEAEEKRRYRVERAEERVRDRQQAFDRAMLSRSVPFRFSDSNRFSLEYELEAVGASGVEAVELYGSTDAGETWKRWGSDPDRSSPFDIETKGEGVFGFKVVVLGNNGLASPRPLPGDDPDIAVIVDQTLPQVRITSARYGEGDRTGSLVIRYECSDDNLMSRPVRISFSKSMEGPWTTIAAGLRNDGLYVWPADPRLPPKIYLRVDATDQAGNTASYVLDQPIATVGLAPRARILGFRSQ